MKIGEFVNADYLGDSVYLGLDDYDKSFQTRHADGCDYKCFNYNHLTPGTQSDNEKDKIKYGNNHNLNKEKCPRCGGSYRLLRLKSGPLKGKSRRVCYNCKNIARRKPKQ